MNLPRTSQDAPPASRGTDSSLAAPPNFWWLLAYASLGGALAEMALMFGARVVLQRYTLLNPQGLWLAPIANALFLAIPLGALWLVARRWGREKAFTVSLGAATFFLFLEPLLVLRGRVHMVAILVLALGAGVQLARMAQDRHALAGRVLRAITVALAFVSLAGAVTFNTVRALRERSALASLPPAAEGAPNIILLVLDTVRAMSLSAYGYERPTTPFLAELAAKGVRFDRAIATAPWTLTSHATMFTGRYPHEMSASWSVPLDDTHPVLAERLSALGYATAGVSANLRYASYEFGLSRGFAWYRDYDVSLSEMWRTSSVVRTAIMEATRAVGLTVSPGRLWGERINERFLSFIDARPADRPFFAFLNYYDAHGPYAPPAPFDTLFLGRQPLTRDPALDSWTPAQLADLQAAYDASLAYLDMRLRELYTELERRGVLRNTVVIVTADHGEEFNEHGHMDHGNSLYFPSVHVPLLVIRPGVVPTGVVVPEPVTLRDLAATIQEFAGTPDSLRLPGTSLAGYWAPGRGAIPELSPRLSEVDFARNLPGSFAISKGDMKSLAIDGLRYIRRGDGFEEMFDIVRDPWESRNLTSDPALRPRLEELRSEVRAIGRGAAPQPVSR